jgi:hypothetical protein
MSFDFGVHHFSALLPNKWEDLLAVLSLILNFVVDNLLGSLVVANVHDFGWNDGNIFIGSGGGEAHRSSHLFGNNALN